MSGHSKWHNIQKKKGAADAKRAQIFTKLAKAITVAAKEGGGDPDMNFSLRLAIDNAKAQNMPKDNIERAILRGAGGGGGENVEEVVYEAFGPGGIALLIRCLTDNRNRTVADMRSTASKAGGSVGAAGSVMWMFDKKGVVRVLDVDAIVDRDTFELSMIDAGADDIDFSDDGLQLTCEVKDFKSLVDAVEKSGLKPDEAGIEFVAKDPVVVEDKEIQEKLDSLVESLEEYDDVDTVFTNAM